MSKIITTESYKVELNKINSNICVLDEYIDARTKIRHKCLVCDNIWFSSPNNIKNGHGCPECKKTKLKSDKMFSLDSFIEKYKDLINENIKIIGDYTGFHNNIECLCLYCGEKFWMTPAVIARGSMHKICASKIFGEQLALDPNYFKDRIQKINPNVELLSVYTRTFNKINCRCKICGYEWKANPNDLSYGKGCIKCAAKQRGINKTFTHEEYLKKLSNLNINIIPLEEYNGMNIKILHKCIKHNVEWKITPSNVLQGRGCKQCLKEKLSNSLTKTHEEYLNELKEKKIDITPLEEYQGACVKILHKYNLCSHEAMVQPSSILSGTGCLICAQQNSGKQFLKTNQEYINELKNNNNFVIPLEDYKTSITKIVHKCTICGYIWKAYPKNILRGHGCPICNYSMGEKRIYKFLKENNIIFEIQKEFKNLYGVNNGFLSYDFYLSNNNLLIEYQGQQHERPSSCFGGEEQFKIQQEHDRRKREYAKEHGIKLLEIWYYDYENIEQILSKNLNSESVETTGGV